jgi:hypothetical protein
MKKKEDLLEKFVEMRISGKTFAEISEALEVSKQSLIGWSKEVETKETISMGKLMRLQSTLKIFELDREARVQRFAVLAQKINAELEKRDLSEIPTDKLLKMAVVNERRLDDALQIITFQDEQNVFDFGERRFFVFNPTD